MKKIFLFLFVAFTNLLAAQNTITEERKLASFKKIIISDFMEVSLKKGDTTSANVETGSDNMGFIKTEIVNDVLKIYRGDINTNNVYPDKGEYDYEDVKVTVYYTQLEEVEVSGTSLVNSHDTLKVPALTVKVFGAGSTNLLLNVDSLITEISGAGSSKLHGIAKTHRSNVSAAGNMYAYDLKTLNTKLEVTGAGNAKIYTSENLTIKADAAGKVFYKIEPQTKKDIGVSGVAEVKNATASNAHMGFDETDTTRLVFGKYRILFIDDKENAKDTTKAKEEKKRDYFHWAGIDLGVNGFLTPGGDFNPSTPFTYLEIDYSKSIGVAINFLEKDLSIIRNRLAAGTGLGVEFNSYAFKNNTTLIPNRPTIEGLIDTTVHYDKSKLKTTWIQAPLLLQLNMGKTSNKSFHIAAGLIGAYKLSSKAKFKYEKEGDTYKSKIKDDFHLNPFRASATVRMGIGSFNIFATYALTSLFETNKGPELYPGTVGITLIGF